MASSLIQSDTGCDVDSEISEAAILNSKILKPLDEVLRCHICFDYFTSCMITKCSHNYCSICIRRHLSYKSHCPTCFQVTFVSNDLQNYETSKRGDCISQSCNNIKKAASEPELQNNRLVDEVLRIYKKIREALQIPCETVENICSDVSSTVKVENSRELSEIDASGHMSSRQPKLQNVSEIAASDNEVSCPVCYMAVSNDRINTHLDNCLKQSEQRNERKTLPKLVYHLLTDKQIRKKLKDHGLSTSGDRKNLIRRHKNFIILYNANSDSLNPKPVSELLVEIDRQELEERINVSQRSTRINKGSDPSEIEKENATYVREHQSQFHALVRDVQQRALGKISIKKESDISQDSISSDIIDDYGNTIGESSFQVGNPSNLDTIFIKQEVSESPPQSPCPDSVIDHESQDKVLSEKKSNTSKQSNTPQLPFRVKKNMPIKKKDDSQSLLDVMSDEELFADSSSSMEDFEITLPTQKKNVRKLSIGDGKGRQRKK